MAFSAAPAYTILLANQIEKDITVADLVYFSIEVGLVVSEWFSDGQQWDFQTAKYKYLGDAKLPEGHNQADLDRGFIASGMWAYSRHPNFAAEQIIWLTLYHWGCYATQVPYGWTFGGAAFLVMLFQGSTWLTELITAGKYPEYAQYQKKVGMFIPSSLRPYKTTAAQPKIIKTSELAKRQAKKQK
jgi:steroid 5-alpha reductase family enzyme